MFGHAAWIAVSELVHILKINGKLSPTDLEWLVEDIEKRAKSLPDREFGSELAAFMKEHIPKKTGHEDER
jgi:hypothetical protein